MRGDLPRGETVRAAHLRTPLSRFVFSMRLIEILEAARLAIMCPSVMGTMHGQLTRRALLAAGGSLAACAGPRVRAEAPRTEAELAAAVACEARVGGRVGVF